MTSLSAPPMPRSGWKKTMVFCLPLLSAILPARWLKAWCFWTLPSSVDRCARCGSFRAGSPQAGPTTVTRHLSGPPLNKLGTCSCSVLAGVLRTSIQKRQSFQAADPISTTQLNDSQHSRQPRAKWLCVLPLVFILTEEIVSLSNIRLTQPLPCTQGAPGGPTTMSPSTNSMFQRPFCL